MLPVIIVSTDGSCLKNPGGAIGWAWVDHQDGHFDSGGAAEGTNQIAELIAILRAVEAHPGEAPLLIESDSQYAIKSATEWLPGWKRKGWRTAAGKPVQNLELIKALDAAISARPGPVRFRWVRGHVGNLFNERADELAGIAARDWEAGRGGVGDALLSGQSVAHQPASGAEGGSDGDTGGRSEPPAPTVRPPAADQATPKLAPPAAGSPRPQPDWEADTLF
ncbi:MAG: ribonuclease HI [Promicromonosporaceae bacterium]|nr:ribonuclease HI [Promicromonosporaceae bacterium]